VSEADGDLINVLVIDDDERIRQILTKLITREGHQVVAVASAEDGLELLPTWTFQVALLDQNLPGMDGLVLGAYLRQNNPDLTIALITGDDDRSLERRSQDLAITYLAKPFRAQDILQLIDDCRVRAAERVERRRRQDDPDFGPPFGRTSAHPLAATRGTWPPASAFPASPAASRRGWSRPPSEPSAISAPRPATASGTGSSP